MIRGTLYRLLMRIAHRYHWHYAPPCYPDGDTQLWCQWCGFRQTIKRRGEPDWHNVIQISKERHVPPWELKGKQ